MSSVLSKRQQARNERTLQDLIKGVPGNNVCADCQAKNPGWASWNLGIFLCMRCAALHRKLGTHISKVKSLSMDSWSADQVSSMKRVGNDASNKVYNPRNVKPPIPIDADEVDSAMERFIRQKYEQRSLVDGKPRPPSRDDYGGRSSGDSPPPLPPKTGKKFGFTLRAHSAQYNGKPSMLSPVRVDVNNPSRIYSAPMTDDTLEAKLATLREMGFPDDKRNSTVLRGLNGDLERTIESLVRLGEASRGSSRQSTPAVTPKSGHFETADVKREHPKPGAKSTNPFDIPTSATSQQQPQTFGISFGQPESPSRAPPQYPNVAPQPTRSMSLNPFDAPAQQSAQVPPLEQAFQSMQISQPLFPHSTGGYPSQQQQLQQARYQQSMTPPVPFLPQQYSFVATPPPISGNSNPFFQSQPAQPPSTNPFFTQPQPLQQTQNQAPLHQSNPFLTQIPSLDTQVQTQSQLQQNQPPFQQQNSQFPVQSQFQMSQPLLSQPTAQPQIPPPQHQFTSALAFPQSGAAQNQPQQSFQNQQHQQQAQSTQAQQFFLPQSQQQLQSFQPLGAQQTGRFDKNSILALYNYPQLAPPMPAATSPEQNLAAPAPGPVPQRSVTMPVSLSSNQAQTEAGGVSGIPTGSRNPFLRTGAGKVDPIMEQPEITRHMSRESVDIHNLQSGRHSPDAFASLSARFVR